MFIADVVTVILSHQYTLRHSLFFWGNGGGGVTDNMCNTGDANLLSACGVTVDC
jgi:hypothetical protein